MPKTKKAPARKVAKKSVRKLAEHEQWRDAIIAGMQEKKAKDIVWIDLRNLKNSVTDFFVICHADSRTHIESIARSIEEYVYKQLGEEPLHSEGQTNAEWILLDYFNVVAHIFLQDKREFYGLERLWADADIQRIASNY
jgi:ribosome-associated protein